MKSLRDLERHGGLLCLDFVNTLDWRGRPDPVEYLRAYGDLLEWSVLSGVLTKAEAQELARHATGPSGDAVVGETIRFREAAYRLITAVIDGRAPDSNDMRTVNATIAQARSRAVLQHQRRAFALHFPDGTNNAMLPLWRIALSLAELLTSEDLQNVRRCDDPECVWLFLDVSKNHKRRWCSMDGCGNRAKARRRYARTR